LVESSLKLAFLLEGGHFYSGSAREILRRRFGVTIGAYSYGECFTPGYFQRNTVVGRYVSIAPGVRTYVREHPTQALSTHPLFFNSQLGMTEEDTIPFGHLVIGHDAWLGCNVVVTAHCERIGIGAVVAAGTLVTKNVPDFAVVGGNPGQFLRFRFSQDLKRQVLESKWWELSPAQLAPFLPELAATLTTEGSSYHPLLQGIAALGRSRDD
jgi:virginiamycin A acetyltransferase